MNLLLRKEIRLLLHAWLGGIIIATMPWWLWGQIYALAPILLCVSLLSMAVCAFGQEMILGTFGLMLAQPAERVRFWRVKVSVLAIAMASVVLLSGYCMSTSEMIRDESRLANWAPVCVTTALVIFSGGLWSTLLLREVVPSLFCTFAVPGLICAVMEIVIGHWLSPESAGFSRLMYGLMLVYAAAGFVWARYLFLRAEDVGWTGGQVAVELQRTSVMRWLASGGTKTGGGWVSLLKKEMQLQEAVLFVLPVLILMHILALVAGRYYRPFLDRELLATAVPFLWVGIVPLVIAGSAIAEERRLGMLESQLCVPISKRAQYSVKLISTLILSWVLGGLMPAVLFMLSVSHRNETGYIEAFTFLSLGISVVAFYASSMTRGLLQAISMTFAVLGLFQCALLACLFPPESEFHYFLQSSLLAWMAIPVMAVTAVWLGFKNYQLPRVHWPLWVRNMVRMLGVFAVVCLTALAIFARIWELFIPLEPSHGAARITGKGRAQVCTWANIVTVLLPDGRLWVGNTRPYGKYDYVSGAVRVSGHFLSGTKWLKAAIAGDGDVIGLRQNGTIWSKLNAPNPKEMGSGSDWKDIAGDMSMILAVKKDGTLWSWAIAYREKRVAPTKGKPSHQGSSSWEATLMSGSTNALAQEGHETDWQSVFAVPPQYVAIKKDGSIWKWGRIEGGRPAVSLEEKMRVPSQGDEWVSMAYNGNFLLGLRKDGTLWANSRKSVKIFGQELIATPEMIRVGNKSDWKVVSGGWQTSAVESNGKLWVRTSAGLGRDINPSKYQDWLAVDAWGGNVWALAKDGTLSCWVPGVVDPEFNTLYWKRIFLGATRRAVCSINILQDR